MCLQQIYGGGKYKDCNDLPIGESAIAFASALNKPDANMYFIFCIGLCKTKLKYNMPWDMLLYGMLE